MMANAITGLRILVSAVLVFCPVFSPIFYVLYLIAGLSDMVDGFIARKTNSVSEFGSRFDGAADFVFVIICLIKILPIIDIPIWLYVWTAVITLIKIINIISGYAIQKKFVSVHSTMNKVTGALLFALPLTLTIVPLKYSGIAICSVATFAAVQEGHFIRTGIITHELTIRENEDGSFMYMGNKILDDGINRIPVYQFRISISQSEKGKDRGE